MAGFALHINKHQPLLCVMAMIERKTIIKNEMGIHCRPSGVIITEVGSYPGTITVSSKNGSCDLHSIMDLIALGLAHKSSVTICVSGPDEEAMADKLEDLFSREYGFPPRENP